jgi:hypothetical protein
MVLAIAFLLAPAVAEDVASGGIGHTCGNCSPDTNYDSLHVGNDRATAFGNSGGFVLGFSSGPAKAHNDLEITKSQNSGARTGADSEGEYSFDFTGSFSKRNIELIDVGNREALAFGYATALNTVKITTSQQ